MQSTIVFASNNANYLNGHCPVIYRASQKRTNRLLSLQIGSRFVRAAVACSILDGIHTNNGRQSHIHVMDDYI